MSQNSLPTPPQTTTSNRPPLRRKVSFINLKPLPYAIAPNGTSSLSDTRSPTTTHSPKAVLKVQEPRETNILGTNIYTTTEPIFKDHHSLDITSDEMVLLLVRDDRVDSGIEIDNLGASKTEDSGATTPSTSRGYEIIDETAEGKKESNGIVLKIVELSDQLSRRVKECFAGRGKENAGNEELKRKLAEDLRRRKELSERHKNMIAKHLANEKRRNAESAMRMRVDRKRRRESSARLERAVKENKRMDGPCDLKAKLKNEAAKLRKKIFTREKRECCGCRSLSGHDGYFAINEI